MLLLSKKEKAPDYSKYGFASKEDAMEALSTLGFSNIKGIQRWMGKKEDGVLDNEVLMWLKNGLEDLKGGAWVPPEGF